MKISRAGMSLFELLIVMTIMGIVMTIGIFTLKKEKATPAVLSLPTLKTTLMAFSQPGEVRLLCDASCKECRVLSNEGKLLTTAHLQSDGTIKRYGFNRFGELQGWGNVIAQSEGKMTQGCFEMSLRPDGTITPLILKNNNTFYVYTPLGDDKPYITKSEDKVRQWLFNEALYPLKGDDAYGAH